MRITVALLIGLLALSALAQPPPFQPKPQLSFALLVQAETDRDKEDHLILTLDTYRVTRQTIVEPESRIRLDTADGKRLLLKYPKARSATVEADAITVIVPVGKKQLSVSAKEFRFYRMDGKRLRVAEAIDWLEKPCPIFLFDNSDTDPPELSDVYRQALHTDCLIAITKRRIREMQTDKLPDSIPQPQPQPPTE